MTPDFAERVRLELLSPIKGRFTKSEDTEIHRIARAKYQQWLTDGMSEAEAWENLKRDFIQSSYWGFIPHLPPETVDRANEPSGLGISLILVSFLTATFGLMSVVWLGQNYTTSGETKDLVWLLLAISLVALMYILLLFKNRRHD